MNGVVPPHIGGVTELLSMVAMGLHAQDFMRRGGAPQRAASLVNGGTPVHAAAAIAARQGKGHFVEIQQSIYYSVRSGAAQQPFHAQPAAKANAPLHDVHVLRGSTSVTGAQVKVGSPAYVARAVRSHPAGKLVVSKEARDVLVARGVPGVERTTAYLEHAGTSGDVIRAAEAERAAAQVIERILRNHPEHDVLGVMVASAKACGYDGLVGFLFGVGANVADAVWHGREINLREAVEAGLHSGLKSAARTAVQTLFVVGRYASAAGQHFSGRVLHRVAKGAVVAGAVAEVIVELAADLLAVLREELTLDQALRRLGINVVSTTCGAIGATLGLAATLALPWWARIMVVGAAGVAATYVGRAVGEALFLQAAPSETPVSSEGIGNPR